jgi:hypothetical protein
MMIHVPLCNHHRLSHYITIMVPCLECCTFWLTSTIRHINGPFRWYHFIDFTLLLVVVGIVAWYNGAFVVVFFFSICLLINMNHVSAYFL